MFLAKHKISKSVSLFLIRVGPNWYFPIRLKDFKSNLYLEQSDEIVYTYIDTRNQELIEKYWGWVWLEMVVAH